MAIESYQFIPILYRQCQQADAWFLASVHE